VRITQGLMYGRLTRDLSAGLQATYAAQQQVTTGRRFDRVSDDPVHGIDVVRVKSEMRALEQYRRNVLPARTRLDTEDAVIGQLLEVLDEATELAVTQGSATAGPETRTASAISVQAWIDQAIQLGNTKVGADYIFGGFDTDNPPFDAAGAYNADIPGVANAAVRDGTRRYEVLPGLAVDGTQTGQAIFVDTGLLQALTDLRDALQANDVAAIGAAATAIDAAFDRVQERRSVTAGRLQQLDRAENVLTGLEENAVTREDIAWNVDVEEAVTRLAAAQSTMQAALLAASRALTTSLTEYLR